MDIRPRVAVVGGGISGLATAYLLGTRDDAVRPDVTLIEADNRLGGKILTRPFAGRPVDTGPDAFLTRAADLRQLIADLGLTSSVVGPLSRNAYVLSRGKLRPLPQGTVFGIPQRLIPLLRSGLLSPLGVMRASADLVLPRRQLPADPSVKELLQPRFGSEVYNRLVEPLLGGVHAGRAHLLSAASSVPDVDAIVRGSRSVYLGLRRRTAAGKRAAQPKSNADQPKSKVYQPKSGPAPSKSQPTPSKSQPPAPVLASLDGGLGRLVEELVTALTTPAPGVNAATLLTGAAATLVQPIDTGFRITLANGETVDADAVVLATPAYATAELLGALAPGAAGALREIQHANVANVTLEYDPSAFREPLEGTGFLVPPEENSFLVGCTWLSTKWPYLANGQSVLIRCAVGRHGDDRWMALGDDALIKAVHDELSTVLQLAKDPQQAIIQRWPNGMPQYTIGHADRLARVDAALGDVAGLYVTGAAYRGVGLAGCVAQASRTAQAVLTRLANPALANPVLTNPAASTQEVLP